jgi:hypothetical protein
MNPLVLLYEIEEDRRTIVVEEQSFFEGHEIVFGKR